MSAETEREFVVVVFISFHFGGSVVIIIACGRSRRSRFVVGAWLERDFRFGCAENLKFERS